jgi:2-iminobutanoate/2-iminopropanoate deaminase
MPFDIITSPTIPTSHLPFSPATTAGGFVFLSGQASVDDTGAIIPDTFENEFRRTMSNITRILAAANCTLADVCQVRSYVKDPADLPEYNRLYREFFQEPYPARTTITNCLGKIKFEMDVVAYRK